jgi:LuxR family transcriptional regulator, maltose regulon positive regulatory protein
MVDFPYKVLVPQRPPHLISRPRLNELLGAITDQCLITVCGPAGYGKTSLLLDFAHVSAFPICWYTLDPTDQDPWVFLDYLVQSIEHRFPGATTQTAALLTSAGRIPFATIAATLARELYSIGHHFTIIIDDWHVVDHVAEIKDIVMHLVLHCPHCHLILSSRSYPSLPNMMLLTARRQMGSFNESQLRFTAEEVADVLEAGYNTVVSVQQARVLADQSHGWITGILLSFQTNLTAKSELILHDMFAERQIYRYMVEQVFDQQTPEVQEFLFDSSLLEELTPEQCDTVFQRIDSRRLLEQLLRHYLFISEIKPGVLRYHPLFREFLQEHYRTIDPQRYREAALQVARFYRAQGQGVFAFDHYMAMGDLAAAQQVVAGSGEQLYTSGRLESLERLFVALPEDALDAPLLCLKARVRLDLGNDSEAQVLANIAEMRAQPDDQPLVMLLHAQLARINGNYEHALDLATRVFDVARNPAQRAGALRTIAICHHRLGQVECAIDELKEALAIEHERGDLHTVALLQLDLGLCYRDVSRLDTAADYYTKSDGYWAKIGNSGLRAMCLNSKGSIQILAGHYLEAHATLITALQYAREASIPHYQATVLSSLGDLYCDLQLWARANAAYTDARRIGGSAYLMSCLDLSEVRLLVRQSQYEAAARALRQLPQATHRDLPTEVLLLRANLACGLGDYDQAAHVAQQAIDSLAQTRAPMELARAYLLQAQIAAQVRPNQPAALIRPLEHAAQIADELGQDMFLVAETSHARGVVRRAMAAGWARAENWFQRHQDMRLAAQMLDQDDRRSILVVRMLGMDEIIFNGQLVKLGWHKAREVLYYLLAHPDGVLIDTLREVIWPDREVKASRDALRSAIYQLRSVLPHELIVLHGRQVYRLNRDSIRIDSDVQRFRQLIETGADNPEALIEALDLYRGPFLSSTDNHWCVPLRTHLEQSYFHALHRVAAYYEEKNAYADALTLYQSLLAMDSLDEAAHAGVMRCHIALDNRGAAINQYHTLRRILDEELGLTPEHASEVEQIYRNLLAAS